MWGFLRQYIVIPLLLQEVKFLSLTSSSSGRFAMLWWGMSFLL